MIRLLLMALVVIAFGSCRSTKSIQTAMSKKDSVPVVVISDARKDSMATITAVYEGIQKNRIDFNTFSAKIKVDFQGSDGKKNDFNAFVRLQKDSALWVSINALLGIEAFRVLITPDSVKVLNKLDKVVQLRSVSYLQEITKIPFSFKQLQDLLVGNPIYLDSNIVSYRKEGDNITILNIGDIFKHLLTVNVNGFTLQRSRLDDVDPIRARTADIAYGDYDNKGGNTFSTFRKITVSDKSKLDIEMKYKQYDFNTTLNFPFSVPKNYKLQ